MTLGHTTSSGAVVDRPDIRQAGAGILSLALMDARNHTLHLLSLFEEALGPGLVVPPDAGAAPPLWTAGHIGWLADWWIGRNTLRALGARCPRDATRLASADPQADGWFNPALVPYAQRWTCGLPSADTVKAYLLDTLETTLELLERTPDEDAALHFFRMALFHEDLRGEQLVVLAQTAGIPLKLDLPPGGGAREPIALPATRWRLGWDEPGFALDIERGSETIAVPEFDIDAQPVTWAQYVEFIDDSGYDRQELWHPQGWQWLERMSQLEGRRAPRHVEQIGVASGSVLQSHFGKPARMGGTQSVMHVTWWEADAYARWAGRRLPTEVEWEVAVHAAHRRGFRWGDVREWMAGSLRPWGDWHPDAWARDAELEAEPVFGQARVLRGASFATRARMKHPRARWWALPERDDGFTGFRTCGS